MYLFLKRKNKYIIIHTLVTQLEQFLQVIENGVDVDAIEKYRTKDNSNLLSLKDTQICHLSNLPYITFAETRC